MLYKIKDFIVILSVYDAGARKFMDPSYDDSYHWHGETFDELELETSERRYSSVAL